METTKRRMPQYIAVFVLLYYFILFVERVQSVIRVLADGAFFATAYDGYVDTLTLLSLIGTLALLIASNGDFWKALSGRGEADYTVLSLTSGVLLLSGMVHTEHTVAAVQFAAYGMLILAMVLRTAEIAPQADRVKLWYSLVYLTSFSMAIPVMYRSALPHAGLFHVVEAIAAAVLVVFFTLMMRRVFVGTGENLLFKEPLFVMAVADVLVLALRWQEKINTFVLIFAALTLALFIAGLMLFRLRRPKT